MAQFDIDRATGIGGSDVPAILGISPYATPTDVWLEKVRHPSWRPKEQTPEMRFGKLLEPVMRAAYQEDTGRRVYAPGDGKTYWGPDGIRYAHIDGLVEGEGVWEGKAPFQTYRNWGFGPPAYVLAQVQHYLDITGEPWCDVSALAAGLDPIFQTWRVPAEPETQADIRKAVLRFWEDRVVPKVPPAELPAVVEYPRHAGDIVIVADEGAEQIVRTLFQNRESQHLEAEREEELKEILKRQIGLAAGMIGDGWRIRFKANRDSNKTDWKLVAGAWRKQLETIQQVLTDAPMVEGSEQVIADALSVLTTAPPDAILSLYTTLTPGARPFVLEATKEDK